MADKVMKIVINDGSVRVPIENMFGEELGAFTFRPTDIDIVKRYNESAEKFAAVVEPLEGAGINPDGTADETIEGSLEALGEAENRLYTLCNYIFGGDMAGAFFGKMNPFSPVDGRFYCEIAIEFLGNFITAQFDVETEKINTRVKSYTDGYSSKKRGRRK